VFFLMKKKSEVKIGIVGLWHLGCVYAASMARLGFEVEGYDQDKQVVADLKLGKPPVFEPELEETIKHHLGKNLRFVDSPEEFFKDKKYVFVTYDLPVDEKDRVSVAPIKKTISLLKRYASNETIVVVSSQVLLGTCRNLSKATGMRVVYFPENVRLGKAFETFLTPDRIILGSDDAKVLENFKIDFEAFKCQFIMMGLESAEMVKHALNSYLATCVSYSSEIADLCELYGANMNDVVAALKTDRRVSPFAPINPGLGFAGATLGRDIQSLKKLGRGKSYKTKLFEAVYKVNQERLEWLIKKIKTVTPKMKGVRVGILGLTYKPGTNTLRRSMSLGLATLLKKEGCEIRAYDPVIKDKVVGYDYIEITKNYDEFFDGLDVVVLMTEWPEFKELPVRRAGELMRKRVMIDTKNFLDRSLFVGNNFVFRGTGW